MQPKALLDLYSDYLLASFGATTATGLAPLLEGQVSHDQVTRFLAGQRPTAADLWRLVKPLVRQLQSPAGVLIIDDSLEEKPYEEKPYTDENESICWHYDHSTGQQVKGINFLTALYHNVVHPQEVSVPGGFQPGGFQLMAKTEFYLDPKAGSRNAVRPLPRTSLVATSLSRRCAISFRFALSASMCGSPVRTICSSSRLLEQIADADGHPPNQLFLCGLIWLHHMATSNWSV